MDTSKDAYETAAQRWEQAKRETIAARRDWVDADEKRGKAEVELAAHEVAPGVPAWSHTADQDACRVRGCRIHGTVA